MFGPLQKSFWCVQSWISVQENQSNETWEGGGSAADERAQTVFLVNRVFVPCPKGAVLTKRRKWRICILPTENKGFAPQTSENDKNDENGRGHSGKGMV